MEPLKCIQCRDAAVAIYEMDRGCVVYPDIKIQPLCPQHVVKATPLGGMKLLKDLRVDKGTLELELP